MAAAAVLATGCSDDFLEVTPPDKATLQEYFNNYDHVMEALVATYNPLRCYDWNDGQYAPLPLCADVMADDVWPGGSGITDIQPLHKMFNFESTQNSSDALTGIWDQSYKGVRNANDVLTYLDWASANMTQEQREAIDAEARTLRAFYYMLLWKYYGNIPFYMQNLAAPYIAEQKGHDEVYATVIADLEGAIAKESLPMQWDDQNLGRMGQACAMMIYAEMVMYQQDEARYAKALGYMRDIIGSGDFDLAPDYGTIFLESGEWSAESIFEISYKDDNAVRSWGGGVVNAGGTVYPRLISPNGGVAAEAKGYLARVHNRAGLTDAPDATIDNILAERHLEFVGEGKRYWDLVRTGRAAQVLTPDEYGYRTNTWSESKKYLPIPLSEIDASQGSLTQNNY